MRIFNIMLNDKLGGTEQAYLDYHHALTLEKHEVINISRANGLINKILPGAITLPLFTSWCPISTIYLWMLIKKYKPDIIIAHGGNAINLAVTAKTNNVNIIGISHLYNKKYLNKCDYVFVITTHIKQYMIDNGFNSQNLFLIPNMLNIKKNYQKRNFKTPITIGSYGRLSANKGFDDLIKAFKVLLEQKYDCRLIIGGSGEYEQTLKNLAEDLNISDKIKFLGWIDSEQKEEFYSQIDIFCLPSKHEPFGLVLLEAMEQSMPIISTKCAGPNYIFTDQHDALLVDIESPEAMAKGFEKLINDPNLAKLVAKNAHQTLVDKYDLKMVAKEITNALQTIIQR